MSAFLPALDMVFAAGGLAQGHGVTYRAGRFVLLDGRSLRPVAQRLGLLYFLLEEGFLVLLLATAVLTAWVWPATGSVNVRAHLDSLGDRWAGVGRWLAACLALLGLIFFLNLLPMFVVFFSR